MSRILFLLRFSLLSFFPSLVSKRFYGYCGYGFAKALLQLDILQMMVLRKDFFVVHFLYQEGDIITAGQCRPLAKTVRFNVVKALRCRSRGHLFFTFVSLFHFTGEKSPHCFVLDPFDCVLEDVNILLLRTFFYKKRPNVSVFHKILQKQMYISFDSEVISSKAFQAGFSKKKALRPS